MLCVCVNRHAVIDASDRVVAQHCLDDLQHRLVLEDLAILGLRQEPEPRARDDQVLEEAAALADQGHLFHDAVEIARGIQDVGVLVQSHSDVLAQQGVEVQVGLGTEAQHRVRERLAQGFLQGRCALLTPGASARRSPLAGRSAQLGKNTATR